MKQMFSITALVYLQLAGARSPLRKRFYWRRQW